MGFHVPRCTQRLIITTLSLLGILSIGVFYYNMSPRMTAYLNNFTFPKQPMAAQNTINVNVDGQWTIEPGGRLGNQMSLYASLYALAKINGHQAYILQMMFNFLAPLFKISLPQLHDSVAKKIPWTPYPLRVTMSDKYKHIKGKFVKLTGYPLSYRYFYHIRDEIKREFTFHDFVREEAYEYLAKLKGTRKNTTYIGVHVRRGDYGQYFYKRWKALIADKAYVDKAMAYFRKKYQEPVFVVVSNDMKWCKDNIDASVGDVYFSGDGIEWYPQKDFALLAHCNHSIMTVGTFGIWSSILAGGETTYLTNFTLPGSTDNKGLTYPYAERFLPEWIGIPADLSPLLLKNNAIT